MKREKEREAFPWKKVVAIGLGVLFVVMMILSAMGMSWIQAFRTVKANDTVVIDYTLRDADGQPVLTTNQNLYQSALFREKLVFLTEPRAIRAGLIGNDAIIPVPAVNYYLSREAGDLKFAILGLELDEMDAAALGMKAGETKNLTFTFPDSLVITMDRNEFEFIGGNYTLARVGDVIPLGLSSAPVVDVTGERITPDEMTFRIGTIIAKTNTSVQVRHRYPSAEITVREFGT